jgi:hypothetical protein
VPVKVLTVYRDEQEVNAARPGENLRLRLQGIEEEDISAGEGPGAAGAAGGGGMQPRCQLARGCCGRLRVRLGPCGILAAGSNPCSRI